MCTVREGGGWLIYKIHRETQALPFVFQIYIQDDEEGKKTCVVVSPKIYQLFAAPAEIEATGKKEFLTECRKSDFLKHMGIKLSQLYGKIR